MQHFSENDKNNTLSHTYISEKDKNNTFSHLYFSEKDKNNTFSQIYLFMILHSHSIPSLLLSGTKLGLKMCVNYARKLISKAVPHSHELHNINLACQHQQACQHLPYWN